MLVFCTLFSKEYERQGKVLLESIRKFHPNSEIYVLALDDETKIEEKYGIKIIRLNRSSHFKKYFSTFLSQGRSRSESIYAIKPIFIEYCFGMIDSNDYLVYSDADIKFYTNLDEPKIKKTGQSVFLSPHKFTSLSMRNSVFGKYNAGFIIFRKDEQSQEVLNKWCDRCKESTSTKSLPEIYADQKYLEKIPSEFSNFQELDSSIINVGSWAFDNQTKFTSKNPLTINNKEIACFHFHNLILRKRKYYLVDLGFSSYGFKKKKIKRYNMLYRDYLQDMGLETRTGLIQYLYNMIRVVLLLKMSNITAREKLSSIKRVSSFNLHLLKEI